MRYLFVVIFAAFSVSLYAQIFPTKLITDNGPIDKRINILILGDGYLSTELDKYELDAQDVMDQLLQASPYAEYANFFNGAIVRVPSNESGTDHPANATDVMEPVFPQSERDTYFNTTFDGFGIHRVTYTKNTTAVYSVASYNFPSYDQILVLINSPEYGGASLSDIATFSTHLASAEIGIHEMGHTFAKLSDEYWVGDQLAAESPNMTQNTNTSTLKWRRWLGLNDIGVYQHCCGGAADTWYRPHNNCKMRYLGVPLCNVCKEQTIHRIYQLVTPINSYLPSGIAQTYSGDSLDFSVDLIEPIPNTLKTVWRLNGQVVGSYVDAIRLASFPQGTSVLTVSVTDTTTLSKKNVIGYVFSKSWSITKNMVAVGAPSARLFYKVFPNPTADKLYVEIGGEFPSLETLIALVSPSGKIVFSERKQLLQESVLEIDVHDFPKGNYFLEIKRGQVRQMIPVVLD